MSQKNKSVPRTAVVSKSKSEKKLIRRKKVTIHVPVVSVSSPIQGFVDFIREQGVIGLAIGLVLGVAIKSVVDSMVNNIFNPIIGLLTGGANLADKSVCLKSSHMQGVAVCTNKLIYGRFVSDLISFIIVAFAVYFLFIFLKPDRLDKSKKD